MASRSIERSSACRTLADWLSGLNYEWLQGRLVSFDGERLGKLTQEARIRLALTELGTTFIKFGQMLSTRADVVGPSLAGELSQLRSHTPPDAPETIKETIRVELGRPIEELFAEFNDKPLASASRCVSVTHSASREIGTHTSDDNASVPGRNWRIDQ